MLALAYPLTLVDGGLKIVSDNNEIVGHAIKSALLTQLTERPYRPDYGYDLDIFNTISQRGELLAKCRQAIDYGLEAYGYVEYELRMTVNQTGDHFITVLYRADDKDSRIIVPIGF